MKPQCCREHSIKNAIGSAIILSVAFSVTLLSLQFLVTKHITEIVSQFEADKINQITMGWFIAIVTYSMLILKTVRTGEDGSEPFTPVAGVNLAVLFAFVAFFIFVAFINNASSYFKANLLVA